MPYPRPNRSLSPLALLCSAAIHVGAGLLALTAPRLLSERLQIPEVYQVELYNAGELTPAPAPPVAAAPEPQPPAPPAVTTISPPQPAAPPAKARQTTAPPTTGGRSKAISLAPLKEQLAREARSRREDAERQQHTRLEQIKLDLRRQHAEEQAQAATSQAVSRIADLYRATSPTSVPRSAASPSPAANGTPLGSGSGSAGVGQPTTPNPRVLEALAAFKARVSARIRPHWVLPEHQDWDPNLSARIIIKVKADGTVSTTWFEKNSGNSRFDQYVKKAVGNSLPLPPLPPEFAGSGEEIAVTFTPGGLK